MRQINAAGLALIKSFEGLRLEAYQDSVGVWTIGYGSTYCVTPNMTITQQEADSRLLEDLAGAEASVGNLVTVPINDNQFAALVSFVFNLGGGALAQSTLLRFLNEGKYGSASEQFARWVYAGGEQLPGLARRREAERELFVTPAPGTAGPA